MSDVGNHQVRVSTAYKGLDVPVSNRYDSIDEVEILDDHYLLRHRHTNKQTLVDRGPAFSVELGHKVTLVMQQ